MARPLFLGSPNLCLFLSNLKQVHIKIRWNLITKFYLSETKLNHVNTKTARTYLFVTGLLLLLKNRSSYNNGFFERLFFLLWDFFFCRETFFSRENFSFAVRLFFCSDTFYFSLRLSISLWDFLFPRETIYFPVKLLISLLDSLFLCETFYFSGETFYFPVRLLISFWESLFFCETFHFSRETFNFPCENISPENYFALSENFWLTRKERFERLWSLCLVLWARHFYSLEKKMSREQKCFGRFCSS